MTEIRAAAGLSTALLMVKAALLGDTAPVHPAVRDLVDRGLAVVDPRTAATARVLLIHHPVTFANRPMQRLDIVAERVVLVLHHPTRNALGVEQYDVAAVCRHIVEAFGGPVHLAPVSGVVRRSLPNPLPPQARLLAQDWSNLLVLDEWEPAPPRPLSWPVTIGRHSRPDLRKWPDTVQEARLALPDDSARFRVRILGAGPYLSEAYGALPGNWEALPYRAEGVADFLRTLDVYAYYHSSEWSEAFGRTILEALAVGLIVILPPHFKPLFETAAVYCEPGDVAELVEAFVDDPDLAARQRSRARAFVEERFDARRYRRRTEQLLELRFTARPAPAVRPEQPRAPVLFVSTNGIGVGHLTRQMAVAERLAPPLVPVFVTMSRAMPLAASRGHKTLYLPHHNHIDADPEAWNRVLAEELFELVAALDPRVLLFDGVMPFAGLTAVLEEFEALYSIWLRRPLWRQSHGGALARGAAFTAVVEPGELAREFDHGPTVAHARSTLAVPPVLLVGPDERLPREAARAALAPGVPDDHLVVALQLGSGANFDYDPVRSAILDLLAPLESVHVVELISPLRPLPESRGERHRVMRLYPSFAHSRGMDACISAAGYNAFHESILGAVPTLFVPNEADGMDYQLARARFAALNGCALLVRRDHDRYRLREALQALLSAPVRHAMSTRCRRFAAPNGAGEVARFVAEAARFVRTDRDISRAHMREGD